MRTRSDVQGAVAVLAAAVPAAEQPLDAERVLLNPVMMRPELALPVALRRVDFAGCR
jgi:hypothetical protein